MRARAALALAIAAALAAGVAASPAPEPTVRLQRRQPLGGVARSVLKKRMARHGNDMEALLAAVLALDYDEVVAVGTRIADEPRLARPGPGSDTANALFPETFFVFQDRLHDDAARIVAAAKARDDDAVAESFGRVTATCVGCHSVYLRMPGDAPSR
jgi:cytochrome c556